MLNLVRIFVLAFIVSYSVNIHAQDQKNPLLAAQFYKNGEYEKALAIYETLYSSKNGSEIFYKEYLNTLFKLKKFDEAEKIIRKKIKEGYSFKLDLGQLFLEKGQTSEAEKTFNNVIAEMPSDPFEITQIANFFYGTTNYDYAIKTFLTGRKILKDEQSFTYELINLYRFKKIKDGLSHEVLNLLVTQPQSLQMVKTTISRTFEDLTDYDIIRSDLLKKIQKHPENTALIDLLSWVYVQKKEFDLALIQLIAYDKRIGTDGNLIYSLSQILIENEAYNAAYKALNYLTAKGEANPFYIPSKIALLKTKHHQITQGNYQTIDIQNLITEYQSLIDKYGKSTQTVFASRQIALLKAYYQNKFKDAILLLEEVLSLPNINQIIQSEVKIELADLYILDNQKWESALLYGQVEKATTGTALAQEAKYKNAKLSFYNGDFNWAKAQLDVLKASTSQLIANDAMDLSLLIQDNLAFDSLGNALKLYAKADLLQFTNQHLAALVVLDSINVLFPNNELADDILMLKSKLFLKLKDYQKSQLVLNEIIKNHADGIWADDALYTIAKLEEEHLKDIPAAQKHYQQLLETFPGSLYAIEARKRFRNLRGDNL